MKTKKYTEETTRRLQAIFTEFPGMNLTNKDRLPEPDEPEYELMSLILKSPVKEVSKNYYGEPVIKVALPLDTIDLGKNIDPDYGGMYLEEVNIYEGRLGISNEDIDGWWIHLDEESRQRLYPILRDTLKSLR